MIQEDVPIADRFPDARDASTDVTKQCQAVMTRLLAVFDAVCRKYDIYYAMIGGTLIGAIRHRGWIPWDMDVDVAVLNAELPRLKQALIKEIPADMFYQDAESDPFFPADCEILKLRDRHRNYYEWRSKNSHEKWHNGLMLDLFPYRWDQRQQHYVGPGALRSFRKDEMFPVTDMEFEGYRFRAPHDASRLMTRVYGTLKMPPRRLRKSHEGRADPFRPCEHPASLPFGPSIHVGHRGTKLAGFLRLVTSWWSPLLARRRTNSLVRNEVNK